MKYKYAVITDVGSTATKAILLTSARNTCTRGACVASHHGGTSSKRCLHRHQEACKALEEKAGIQLFENAEGLSFLPEVQYLSSSSAGGRLADFGHWAHAV